MYAIRSYYDVFQGQNTREATILVEHHHDVDALLQEAAKGTGEIGFIEYFRQFTHQAGNRTVALVARLGPQQVAAQHETDEVFSYNFV